ncbi:hypothetical protein SprV_0200858200 [Sparganum proliferum]
MVGFQPRGGPEGGAKHAAVNGFSAITILISTTVRFQAFFIGHLGTSKDNLRSNRPERRTALVARELARYKVDIDTLSETRFFEQSQLEEVGAGYTFLWSGRPSAERFDAGISSAIGNDIVGRSPCLPQTIKD